VQFAFYASIKAFCYDDILEVNKIEPVGDDDAQVYLCRSQQLRDPDFPAFPVEVLAVNGGVLEEYDEQAVLAAPVSTGAVVSGLLDKLVKGEHFLPGRVE
jgi:hypothetical protein